MAVMTPTEVKRNLNLLVDLCHESQIDMKNAYEVRDVYEYCRACGIYLAAMRKINELRRAMKEYSLRLQNGIAEKNAKEIKSHLCC
jgi:hypothetical protein